MWHWCHRSYNLEALAMSNPSAFAFMVTSLAVSIVELPWSPQTFDENLRFFRFIREREDVWPS